MILNIIDSALVDKRGHHYEYVKSVYDEWVGRGLSSRVYCHRHAEADIVGYFHAKAIFSRSFHTHSRKVPGLGKGNLLVNLLVGNHAFYRELRKIGTSACDSTDMFLVHTIDPNQLFGLYLWYFRIPPGKRPCLALVFRMGVGDNTETRRYATFLYRLFFRAASALKGGRIVFFTDSEKLAAEYGELTTDRISVLPIPHIPKGRVVGTARPEDGYLIVYPGEARSEKGYHLLPSVIESVLSGRDDVQFVVQSNISGNPPEAVREARRRIEARKHGVVYIDRILESGEYYEILSRADAVLLPYSPETYRGRTSGIFAEAIAFGKPVIVPGGTWMAQQISEYGGCGVAMHGYGEESLLEAVETLIDHREEYRERARRASARFREFHNAGTYVDILVGSTGNRISDG